MGLAEEVSIRLVHAFRELMVKAIQSIERAVPYYVYNYCVCQFGWRKRGRLMGRWAVSFFGRSGPLVEGYALFGQLGTERIFFFCLLISTFTIVSNN